jgi:hypothetical protein
MQRTGTEPILVTYKIIGPRTWPLSTHHKMNINSGQNQVDIIDNDIANTNQVTAHQYQQRSTEDHVPHLGEVYHYAFLPSLLSRCSHIIYLLTQIQNIPPREFNCRMLYTSWRGLDKGHLLGVSSAQLSHCMVIIIKLIDCERK